MFKRMFFFTIALLSITGMVLIAIAVALSSDGQNPTLFFNSAFSNIANLIFYFTIQSNIFISVYFLFKAFSKNLSAKFHTLETALTLYIFITGSIYLVLLSGIKFKLGPLYDYGNILVHYVVPLLCIIEWLFLASKRTLKYSNILTFSIFPLCYLILTLVRGSLTNFYPYPFANVSQLGFLQVIINSFFILLFMAFSGALLIALNNLLLKIKR